MRVLTITATEPDAKGKFIVTVRANRGGETVDLVFTDNQDRGERRKELASVMDIAKDFYREWMTWRGGEQ